MCTFSPTNNTHSINLYMQWKLLATYSPRLLSSFRVVLFVVMRRQSCLSQLKIVKDFVQFLFSNYRVSKYKKQQIPMPIATLWPSLSITTEKAKPTHILFWNFKMCEPFPITHHWNKWQMPICNSGGGNLRNSVLGKPS